jgi:DNA-binding transcriptional ArsR family regulator
LESRSLVIRFYFDYSGNVELSRAVTALSALAQDTRLETFRLLVQAGSSGLAAGEIARRLDVPANTLSSHLGILSQANLVTSHRDGRSVIYAADYDGMGELLAFLVADCCEGRPEACGNLLREIEIP